MKGKNILVLGGTGFIGSHLTQRLVQAGAKVKVFTRPGKSVKNIANVLEKIELIYGDFMDEVSLKKAVSDVDCVVHLISTTFPSTTLESGVYDVYSNLIPTIRLLEYCVKAGVEQIVYASSGGTIYGEPEQIPITEEHPLIPKSMYGQSKKVIESYFSFFSRTYRINVQTMRISNPYGPRQNPYGAQGIIAVALGCVLDGRKFKVFGKGDTVRDYIYIDDVIDAMLCAIETKESAIVNVSSGKGKSVNEILETLERISGRKIDKIFNEKRLGDVSVNILSNQSACQLYSWRPQIELEEGLVRTWDWLLQDGYTVKNG
ncbi:nucleoside-diphosphate sugar epimerase [Candidatus Thiomargarita nelsonii]|uniref:UDP-glucose 4-epimerase n=1 Tax=Candidatus Thiomargarita nelsonii TaxID=1003181 RepID=A0A4E0QXD2_9GAMM|nr:nucleoside-diphosphate sugar epimerase [Candidatus Thiomargarita nelsonii]